MDSKLTEIFIKMSRKIQIKKIKSNIVKGNYSLEKVEEGERSLLRKKRIKLLIKKV